MPKYKKILLAALLILVVLIVLDYFFPVSPWIYVGIVLVVLGLFVYGSGSIRSDFYTRVLWSADSAQKVIALTFDDGPDEQVTPQVLDILKKHRVKAVFFCIGSKALQYPFLLERMDQEGHIIGGHSWSHHFFFDLFSSQRMERELDDTVKLIQRIIQKRIRWFRPPYGVINPALARVMQKKGYRVIGWSLKSKDTVIRDETKLLKRIMSRLEHANVILFHDTGLHLVQVLDTFLTRASEHHYTFVRLDELFQIEAYE